MLIAAFVDPTSEDQDLAIELIVSFAEFCVERHRRLQILSDLPTALELGVALLGTRESRTVEGGEYRSSPISLLPFIHRESALEYDALASSGDDEIGGTLEEFYHLGLFERRDEELDAKKFAPNPASVFEDALVSAKPTYIIGIGPESEIWASVGRAMERRRDYKPKVLVLDGFEPVHIERPFEPTVIRRPEIFQAIRSADEIGRDEGEFEGIRLSAVRDGALLAGLLNYTVSSLEF